MSKQPHAGYGEDRLLTREEVAAQLGVSLRTVARLADTDELPRVRIGRAVRFRERDVAGIVASGALHDDERPACGPGAQKTAGQGRHDSAR